MNAKDRRKKYNQYLKESKAHKGSLTEASLTYLNDAMTVSDDDVYKLVDEILDEKDVGIRSIQFSLLSEDLRDLRDGTQIKLNRSDILSDILDSTDDEHNERYLFLG